MENAVKYKIFIKDGDSFVCDSSLEVRLANYLAFLSPIIEDFIWQKEPFCLVIKPCKGDVPAHLHGKTKFGDNVDDEWFIVSLLFKLSQVFPETCVSISDNDGEFLLIEAAHFLPRWINPGNSKNRVFVHKGKLHILPIPSNPGEVIIYPAGTPTVLQALQLIFGVHKTEAAAKIQSTISQRINILSAQSQNTQHHAHCYVPAEVKHVLDQKPSLISPIVQAFYERDPADVKACRTMEQFTLKKKLMTRIRFTRCMYAQISQQPFTPDMQSEWSLPPASDPQYKAHELGLKLACGFQILCKKSGKRDVCTKEDNIPKGPKWETFFSCLKEQGYFKGEVEGSKLYQDLLTEAQQQFTEHFTIENRDDPGDVIQRILKDTKIDVQKMQGEQLLPADDDSWLTLSENDLHNLLAKYSDPNSEFDGNDSGTQERNKATNDGTPVDLDSVTRNLKAFVDKVSSYEGAEFPGDGEDDDIQFDADSFMETVGSLLGHASKRSGASRDSDGDDEDELMSSDEESEPEQGVQGSTLASAGKDREMQSYMEQMDAELARTSIGESFEKGAAPFGEQSYQGIQQKQGNSTGEIQEENGEDAPVDVDFNLVKNILESFSTQQGLAGPASNILNSMGVWLPPNKDSTDSTQQE